MTDLSKPLIMTEKEIDTEENSVRFVIKAVIKKKLVFSTRPTPLRNNIVGEDTKKRKLN